MLLLITALLFLVKLPFLILADGHGKTVITLPLAWKKDFSLYYMHSVHKTPVWENFFVDQGNRLVLTSTRFQSLGVGVPFLPGEGELVFENGKIILKGLDRSFSEINLMLTPVAEQALLRRNKSYYLNDYFGPGDLIRIRAVRSSPGKVLWQRIITGGELID
ncbi:MAG: DUF1850 domain-containing protein [Bacillota bacterium]